MDSRIKLIAGLAVAGLALGTTFTISWKSHSGIDVNGEASGRALLDGSGSGHRLVWLLADAFMAENELVLVSVGIGGSNEGFRELLAGEIDIAVMSRPIKDEEREEAPPEDPLQTQVIARDHVMILVHRDFPMQSATRDELRTMLRGQSIAATDFDAFAVLPTTDSGTLTFLTDRLGIAPSEVVVDRTAENMIQTVELIAERTDSIGIISSSHLSLADASLVRPLRIIEAGSDEDMSPTEFLRDISLVSLHSRLDRNSAARAFYEAVPRMVQEGEISLSAIGLIAPSAKELP